MRPLYWTIFVLVVLALATIAVFYLRKKPVEQAPSPQAAQVAKDLREKPYTEHGEGYDISAAYPTTTPMGEAGALEMQGWVIAEIGRFKDTLPASAHPTLSITYEASSTATAATYLFTENIDGAVSTKAFAYAATSTP